MHCAQPDPLCRPGDEIRRETIFTGWWTNPARGGQDRDGEGGGGGWWLETYTPNKDDKLKQCWTGVGSNFKSVCGQLFAFKHSRKIAKKVDV